VMRSVPKGTVVLENLCWQQLAVAAEEYRSASSPTPVSVYVPGPDATVDGTIQVDLAPKGDRYVTLLVKGLRISADIGPDGAVEHVRVPAQYAEARGHATGAPAAESKEAAPAATTALDASLSEEPVTLARPDAVLHGTLTLPKDTRGPVRVVLIVAGSGPTDRDGNNSGGLTTDSYKQLAAALGHKGIATLRYDKRGIGESTLSGDRAKIVLADFTEDARALVAKLGADPRFSSVSLLGHSEGGVIGLELAQLTPLNALVLVGTPGRPLAVVLHEQLSRKVDAATLQAFDRGVSAIRSGTPATNVPKELAPLLDEHIAAFLRSWMDVDPPTLVPSVKAARVAIVQGDMDMQISVDDDARKLAAVGSAPRTELTIVPGMAHTLKIEKERTTQQASYFDSKVPLAPALVDVVAQSVK
jgi:pimeloyl-ACP methyl ester carboxylesterase